MARRDDTTVKPMRDIYLRPGEFHFGRGASRIRTVLGSCVAITLWHPVKRVGGMCHYLLPRHQQRVGAPNGLYAEDAVELFLRELERCGCTPQQFETRVVGGGRMFGTMPFDVARRNVEAARTLLEANGFLVAAEHVGGDGHRYVILDLTDGRMEVNHFAPGGKGR